MTATAFSEKQALEAPARRVDPRLAFLLSCAIRFELRWVTERRRKKRAEQKESKSYEQTQPSEIEQTSGADNDKSIVPTNANPAD